MDSTRPRHIGLIKVLYYPTAGLFSTSSVVAIAETVPSESAGNPGAVALEKFNAGDWSTAIDLARQQITSPSCSNAIKAEMHHIEAACLYQMGQLQEAEKAIRSAVFLEPAKENYLNTYGVILRKNKRTEQADSGNTSITSR